jgi:hypothetical protein
MDFSQRLLPGESISIADSVVKVYDSDNVDVTATYASGTPTASRTRLQQDVKWAGTVADEVYKVSFRAKVGSGVDDHVYEDDILVTIED